jgi:hypothetical protein
VAYSSPEFKDGLVQPVGEGFIHFSPLLSLSSASHIALSGAAAATAFVNGFKPDYHSYCLQMMCYMNKFGQFENFVRPTEEEGRFPFVF